jgi:hypothetical protein
VRDICRQAAAPNMDLSIDYQHEHILPGGERGNAPLSLRADVSLDASRNSI